MHKTDLANDGVLNIVLSGALAVGVILTSLIQGYRGNLMSVLFGDILARLVLLSVIVGSISSIVGIFVSGLFNFACDPSIVIVQFVVYVAVFGWVSKKVCPTLILLGLIPPTPISPYTVSL